MDRPFLLVALERIAEGGCVGTSYVCRELPGDSRGWCAACIAADALESEPAHRLRRLMALATPEPSTPESGETFGMVYDVSAGDDAESVAQAKAILTASPSTSGERCGPCRQFDHRFACNAPGECDCPRCQGICECPEEGESDE